MILVTNNEGTKGAPITAQLLARGTSALDAVEAGVRGVESDPGVRTVGKGGWPNLIGEIELDAAIMDGDTLRTGSVGALKGFAHPISVARAVLERLPHEMLVGEGAARFAAEIGAEQDDNLLPDTMDPWKAWFSRELSPEEQDAFPGIALAEHCRAAIDPEKPMGTTVFLALDGRGSIAGGVSTAGWAFKYPGRLGDSPVIGAGMYADSAYGAAACTGAGEMAIRTSAARSAVLYMKMGMTIREALDEVVRDLARLKGGLVDRITLHAVSRTGEHRVLAVNAPKPWFYWLWDGEGAPRWTEAERAASR
ncbi:asparaginase [Alsobacter soli]|uniref:Asparaginase n=1 Tax=Alsobacter soli TaxID=2109933 RepID=A0A2T1HYN3_9HYPH|nr:N(4)-(beta-N-acetylglucosaminyl)-L-asparaginase [Alsobacter soli]PSC06599.1 asparaginase [Alsobacter soli]